MELLDELIERKTGMLGASDFKEPPFSISCDATGNVRYFTPDMNEEYELIGLLRVRFWANKQQYQRAREYAEKTLIQRLYGETFGLLTEAEKAVYDGDARAVLEIIGTIRQSLTNSRY